ncbi:Tubulin-tyrosine ligase family [Phytophthora cinnamomi]|nr:Tubulin-tyrosine ligase family [Phytophthora cinnamomi]
MHTDNQKLEHAITSCQRSADQRFQLLEKHRQSLEAENCHLRGELSSLKQDYTRLSSKLQDIGNGEFDMEKDLDGDGLQIAEYTAQLNSEAAPVMELEQVVTTTTASSTTTTDLDQENFRGQAVAASAGINQ